MADARSYTESQDAGRKSCPPKLLVVLSFLLRQSLSLGQAGLKLTAVLLPQFPEYYDERDRLPAMEDGWHRRKDPTESRDVCPCLTELGPAPSTPRLAEAIQLPRVSPGGRAELG